MAWLNTELDGNSLGCRADILKDDNPYKKLPEVKFAPYLLEYALELGLFKNGQMGIVPVDWVDISAWLNLVCLDLHPEEIKIIRTLSIAYVAQTRKSKEQTCPAPYKEEDTAVNKSANIKAQMAQFRRKNNK